MIDFYENGSLAAAKHICSIGNNVPTATLPLLVIFSSSTEYQVQHNQGVTVTCSLTGTAPTSGQRVQLRWWLYSDGSVQLWQSINLAAETTAARTAANALAAAWSATAKYNFNSYNGATGAIRLIGAVVMAGNQTQAVLKAAMA